MIFIQTMIVLAGMAPARVLMHRQRKNMKHRFIFATYDPSTTYLILSLMVGSLSTRHPRGHRVTGSLDQAPVFFPYGIHGDKNSSCEASMNHTLRMHSMNMLSCSYVVFCNVGMGIDVLIYDDLFVDQTRF